MATVIQLLVLPAVLLGQLDPLTHVHSLSDSLRNPAGIEVLMDGTVLVADLAHNQIARYDDTGATLPPWPVPEGPIDIAANLSGTAFYVSLRDGAAVAVYDGSFARTGFLGDGDPLVNFVGPTDIDVAIDTGVAYVVDSKGDRVYGFNPDGTLALMFGIRGNLHGEFLYPTAIAVDEFNGRLIVADQDNFRVQIFTLDGVYVRRFGYRNKYLPGGLEEGWMPRSQGMEVDFSGRIYVADSMMSTVRVFDAIGVEIGKVLAYGAPPAGVRAPFGLTLSPDGSRLFVVSTGTASVEVFNAPTFALPVTASDGGTRIGYGPHGAIGHNTSSYDAIRFGASVPLSPADLLRFLAKRRSYMANRSGAATGAQTALASTAGFDGPHMVDDATTVCGRCHGIDGQPGTHPGTLEGQVVTCLSCHLGDGQAMVDPVAGPPDADPYAVNTNPQAGLGRSHPWGVPAVNAAVGSAGPPVGSEMEQYLDNGNIKCATCHNQHNSDSGTPYLRANNTNGAMCRKCHTDHIGHTPAGPWQPTCEDCHNMHDLTSENLSSISPTLLNQTLAAQKTVVFTAQTGPNSFSDGIGANDGICQVCHVTTAYHRHDGTGAAHNEGQACTGCHPHDAGFMPAGGSCTGCHSSPQDNGDGIPVGGRRAMVGEFPMGDAHAHYGAELNSSACTVCHDQTTHMDGNVDLIDADSGALYSFVRPSDLTSDPDLSDFCASCHDSDGAARLASPADPFGNGNAPPDAKIKFQGTLQWTEEYGDDCFGTEGTQRTVNSHHDISDADQAWSGAKIECLSCHGAHTSGGTQPVAEPFNPVSAWQGTTNDFCLECHWGGFGPADPALPPEVGGPTIPLRGIDSCDYQEPWWYVDYSWTHSAHGPDSKRGWNGYSGADAYDVDCMACHDPHGSYTATNTQGNPYMIRDSVDGTPYIDDGTRTGGFNGPPFSTTGTTRDVVVSISGIDVDWGSNSSLCGACHADWIAAYSWHSFCTGCQTCHGHGQAFGASDFVAPRDDAPCPSNDQCDSAGVVTPGASVPGTTGSADDDVVPACGGSQVTEGVWYQVTGTGNTLTATTCSVETRFDTSLQVFCDGCDALTCVGGSDDDSSCGSSATNSTVSWCSDRDQVYFVYLGSSSGESGWFEFLVTDDGTPCGGPDGCPLKTGACCVTGICQETDTHDQCDALGGTWVVDEDCATFTCPTPPPITAGVVPPTPTTGKQSEPIRRAPVQEGGPDRLLHLIDRLR